MEIYSQTVHIKFQRTTIFAKRGIRYTFFTVLKLKKSIIETRICTNYIEYSDSHYCSFLAEMISHPSFSPRFAGAIHFPSK